MTHQEYTDRITEIRAKNNKNWMKFWDIAFKYAPEEASEVLRDIIDCDAQINELSRKLAGG